MKRPRDSGITLVEVMVVIAIIGILAAIAVPSYQDMIERNRLKQAAESLQSDMQFARTEAIKRSRDVLVTRSVGNAGAWCYGLTTKAACDCSQTDAAAADYCEIRRFPGGDLSTISMAASVADSSFSFRRGTSSPHNITFTAANSDTARILVSYIGRVRICTTSGLFGYPAC
jgi:type IV fimbrial biogenesis protein FimT